MQKEKKIWLMEQYAQKAWMVSLVLSQEAARAGENGRGYAVVAHESRILADRLYEHVADIRFGGDEKDMFKGIMDFVTMFKLLSANATLENLHMVDVSMEFNIPKSIAVFVEELRRIAVLLEALADESLQKKPITMPELASPLDTAKGGPIFLYSIGGHPLIENPSKIKEILILPRASIMGEKTMRNPRATLNKKDKKLTLRGEEIAVLDCYRLLDLSYADSDMQTVIIINPNGQGHANENDLRAVPIDGLDMNAYFYTRHGRDVPPKEGHAFAGYARECWDVIGGDQVIFADWAKLIAL